MQPANYSARWLTTILGSFGLPLRAFVIKPVLFISFRIQVEMVRSWRC